MRFRTLIACVLIAGSLEVACAQRSRQRVSPHETTQATIDGAEISINYGRPTMRGRKIMGALVPYGRIWCPGADEATRLTTNRALKIGNLQVPAGSYSLWMLPAAGDWTLIVNQQANAWHTRHPPNDDLGQVPLQKRSLSAPVEQLTFSVEKNPEGPGGDHPHAMGNHRGLRAVSGCVAFVLYCTVTEYDSVPLAPGSTGPARVH